MPPPKAMQQVKEKKELFYLVYIFTISLLLFYLLIKAIAKETTVMLDSLFTMDYKKSTNFIFRSVTSFSPDTLKLY